MVERTSAELIEFLKVRLDSDEIESIRHVSPVNSMTWDKKKSCWVIRVDNKRVMEITSEDFPEDINIREYEFVNHILGILRSSGVDGLRTHIEEIRCLEK